MDTNFEVQLSNFIQLLTDPENQPHQFIGNASDLRAAVNRLFPTPQPTADTEERARELTNLIYGKMHGKGKSMALIRQALTEERERAAGICEKLRHKQAPNYNYPYSNACSDCAAAIRGAKEAGSETKCHTCGKPMEDRGAAAQWCSEKCYEAKEAGV